MSNGSKTVVDTSLLLQELARLKAENERLSKQGKTLSCKVSDKGAMSVYHGSRFPTTLYASQWEWLLAAENVDKMLSFLRANADKLARKEQE